MPAGSCSSRGIFGCGSATRSIRWWCSTTRRIVPVMAQNKCWGAIRGYVQADAYSGYDGVYLESDGQDPGSCLRMGPCPGVPGSTTRATKMRWPRSRWLGSASCTSWRNSFASSAPTTGVNCRRTSVTHSSRPGAASRGPPLLGESFTLGSKRSRRGCCRKAACGRRWSIVRNHWTAFCRYTDDGRIGHRQQLEAEREMRAIAIGRKNWLFCGSERGRAGDGHSLPA